VRRLIRDDGGGLETSSHRAARYADNFVLISSSVLAMRPLHMPDNGHAVLDAADGRIRELLQLKRDRGRPPRTTALAELDDLALLGLLESVQANLVAGSVDEEQMLKQRTKLLDGLRLVPVAGDLSPTEPGRNDDRQAIGGREN
jgi:hypothetical protein